MLEALKNVESVGAQVTYDASLISLPEITEKYKTVTMGEIGSKLLGSIQPLESRNN